VQEILSIQSHVAYGYVGNRAAVFPLQRLGYDVTAINTVQFSNHTGYGEWTGHVHDYAMISELIAGVTKRNPLNNYSAILTGYMGDAVLGEIVLDLVTNVKQANPNAIYCCDPVIGDVGRGTFVRVGLPEFFRQHAIQQADIITPNEYELAYLSGIEINSLKNLKIACDKLHGQGPGIILVTSVTVGMNDDEIGLLVSDGDNLWQVMTPRLPLEPAPNGAGDATAAIFLAKYLEHKNVEDALEFTANAIYTIFSATHQAGTRELQLIASQEQFVQPDVDYDVYKLII
tara:strand:+ start:41046 stop:41906 length:861 start_codon:yes stop_codon:yes gene_type:complete